MSTPADLDALSMAEGGSGSSSSPTAQEARFNAIVAHLEDVILGGRSFTDGPPLLDELEAWSRAHCSIFLSASGASAPPGGSSEAVGSSSGGGTVGSSSGGGGDGGAVGGPDVRALEHSPVWYDLFMQYTALVEARIEASLGHLDPPCTGEELADLMQAHAEELSGDVFDLLMSLNNYEEFVQTMISYAEQTASEQLGGGGGGGIQLEPTVTRFTEQGEEEEEEEGKEGH